MNRQSPIIISGSRSNRRGYGLSYSTFTIAPPVLDKPKLGPGGRIVVSTTITNTGARAGDEIIQLYLHQRAGRASRPVRLLEGFQRVSLSAGEARQLNFTIDETNVQYWNAGTRSWVIDPGVFDLWLGINSLANLHTTFTGGGKARAASAGAALIARNRQPEISPWTKFSKINCGNLSIVRKSGK